MRGEARKIVVKRLIKDEKGQALVMVLILMLIGGLISGPLLSYMGTGFSTGEVYEKRTVELYAADAGVEDAVWKIQQGEVALCPGDPTYDYTISDVNGKSVDVTITSFDGSGNLTLTYRVVATATGDGSGTEIEAYIFGVNPYGDYEGLLGQVLTSQGEIDTQGANVTPLEGEHAPVEYYDDSWPTGEELAAWYLKDVAGEEPYDSDTFDLVGFDEELGPFYRDGELDIVNTSNDPATLTLTGTVYIAGDTLIGKNGKDFNLNLDGHTIFVASNSSNPQKALWIGGKCTIIGSGIIIAIGDIYFEPKTEAGVTDPIFIMSVDGTTTLQPAGDFYGSIAGSVEIDLQPNTSVNYPVGEDWYDNLNFLVGVKMLIFHIASWEVIPLSPE
jgi:hypothetical protein